MERTRQLKKAACLLLCLVMLFACISCVTEEPAVSPQAEESYETQLPVSIPTDLTESEMPETVMPATAKPEMPDTFIPTTSEPEQASETPSPTPAPPTMDEWIERA